LLKYKGNIKETCYNDLLMKSDYTNYLKNKIYTLQTSFGSSTLTKYENH